MTTRRQIIQAGAVLGAVAAPGAAALAATPGQPQSKALPLYKVAFDSRTSAGLIFGAEAKRLGLDVHDTAGDITALYADDLLARWKTEPSPVAGMTTHASMFVLQMMATSADMRLVWRVNHAKRADGAYSHALFGPAAIRAEAGELSGPEAFWARKSAQIVARWPVAELTVAGDRSNIASADEVSVPNDSLVTWVLAPVRQAAALIAQNRGGKA